MLREQKFYKIYNKVTKEFVGAGLASSKHGKTWSTLGHAKSAIATRGSRKNDYVIVAYKATPITGQDDV